MRQKRCRSIAGWTAALMCVGAIAIAQADGVQARLTFVPVDASKAGLSEGTRLDIVVERWSAQADRDQVMSAFKEQGADGLAKAIASSTAVGYLHWPGNLDYTLRYAHRVARPDGGEEIVLATDTPVRMWWVGQESAPASLSLPTIIEVRIGKDGRGEGKIGQPSSVAENQQGHPFALRDFDRERAVLTDVRRERASS